MYILKFWFEHGGICLWSANDLTRNKYGYPVENESLPISQELVDLLYSLEDEYIGYLDWDYPSSPSPWSEEQKESFKLRATSAYNRLVIELGESYQVINGIDDCVI